MADIQPRQFADDILDQNIEARMNAAAAVLAQPASTVPTPPTAAATPPVNAADKKQQDFRNDPRTQILGGLEDSFKNTMNGVFSIGEAVNSILPADYQMDSLDNIPRMNVEETSFPITDKTGWSGAGLNFLRTASQFLIPFGAASKGIRAVTGLEGAANLGASTAITGFFALDPAEKNLSNVIQSVPELQNPISEFLASDGSDTFLSRLKNSVNTTIGLAVGNAVVEKGVVPVVKAGAKAAAPAVKAGAEQVSNFVDTFINGVKAVKDKRDLAKQGFTSDTIKPLADIKNAVTKDQTFSDYVANNVNAAVDDSNTNGILTGAIKPAEDAAGNLTFDGIKLPGSREPASPAFLRKANLAKEELVTKVFGDKPGNFDNDKILRSAGLVDDPVISDLMKFASEQSPKTSITWDETNARAFGMTAKQATEKFGTAGDFTAAIGAIKNEAVVRAARLSSAVTKNGLDHPETIEALAQFLQTSSMEKMISGEAGRALGSLKQTKNVANILQNIDVVTKSQMEAALKSFSGSPEKMLGFGRQIGRSRVQDIKTGLTSFWINNVLSGPITHVTNLVSNMAFLALRPVERLGAAGIGDIRNRFGLGTLTGGDRALAGEVLQMYHGYYEGFRDALRSIRGAESMDKELQQIVGLGNKMDTSATSRGNLLLKKSITGRDKNLTYDQFRKSGPIGMGQEFLARSLTAPTDLLGFEDNLFKAMAARGQKRALAFRNSIDQNLEGPALGENMNNILNNTPLDATDRILLNNINEAAGEFARESTFNKELGEAGESIIKMRDGIPGMQFIVPFVKTPINILDETFLRRTPLGLASKRIRNEILAGGAKSDEAIARMAIGTFISGSIAAAYTSGNITGAGPKAKAYREKWLEDHQPWSIKINNEWYSYNRIEPLGSLLGLGARFAEVLDHDSDAKTQTENDKDKLSFSIAAAFTKYVTDKSIMVGIDNVLSALEGDEAAVEKLVSNIGGGFVPYSGLMRTVANTSDPELRDMDGILDRISAGIPGLSETLPNLRNRFGDKVIKPAKTVEFLLPISHTPGGIRDKKTLQINQIETDANIALAKPDREFRGIKLTLEEQDRRLETFNKFNINGLSVKDALIASAKTPEWNFVPSSEHGSRGEILKSIYRGYLKASDETFLQQNPEISVRVQKAMMDSFQTQRQINTRTGEPQVKETFIGATK